MFTGFFALGLILISRTASDVHLTHILYGNVLGIEPDDVLQTLVAGTVALVAIAVLRRDLLLFCFDPNHARAIGLNTTVLYYVLLALLALTVVAALQAVGLILVIAMLITPGAIGYLLIGSLRPHDGARRGSRRAGLVPGRVRELSPRRFDGRLYRGRASAAVRAGDGVRATSGYVGAMAEPTNDERRTTNGERASVAARTTDDGRRTTGADDRRPTNDNRRWRGRPPTTDDGPLEPTTDDRRTTTGDGGGDGQLLSC